MKKSKTELLAGTLDLIVLKMLQSGPANGWDITQRIQVLSEDVLSLNYGSLYPALHRLEARGWITSEWGASDNNRRAKFYKLTSSGRRQLEAERATWERFSNALDAILQKA
jgi:PadR family transcriptional regulator PadR